MKITPKKLTVIAMTAAVYALLTVGLSPISYGEFQCRLSESLNLLAFINPLFAPGIILGCFIANLFSPIGVPDWIFGTAATAVSMLFVTKFSKNMFIASIWPVVFNGVIIGAEILFFFSEPPFTLLKFLSFSATVMAGQVVAVMVVGYIAFSRLMKNDKFASFLKNL